jgi:hypothetical protein
VFLCCYCFSSIFIHSLTAFSKEEDVLQGNRVLAVPWLTTICGHYSKTFCSLVIWHHVEKATYCSVFLFPTWYSLMLSSTHQFYMYNKNYLCQQKARFWQSKMENQKRAKIHSFYHLYTSLSSFRNKVNHIKPYTLGIHVFHKDMSSINLLLLPRLIWDT